MLIPAHWGPRWGQKQGRGQPWVGFGELSSDLGGLLPTDSRVGAGSAPQVLPALPGRGRGGKGRCEQGENRPSRASPAVCCPRGPEPVAGRGRHRHPAWSVRRVPAQVSLPSRAGWGGGGGGVVGIPWDPPGGRGRPWGHARGTRSRPQHWLGEFGSTGGGCLGWAITPRQPPQPQRVPPLPHASPVPLHQPLP